MSNDTMALLRSFCAADFELREWMRQPWLLGEHIYATNGHFMVRVPKGDLVAGPCSFGEKAAAMFAGQFKGTFEPLPAIPEPEPCETCEGEGKCSRIDCADCDGKGSFEHGRHDYMCKECDGDGEVSDDDAPLRTCRTCWGRGHKLDRDATSIRIGEAAFQATYLHQIAKLPGVVFAANGPAEAGAFRFDGGGEGLVMPVRQP